MRSSPIAPPRSLAFRAHAALWAVAGSTAALYLGWTLLGPVPDETVALKADRRQTAIDGRNLENALLQLSGDVRAVQPSDLR